MIFLNTFLLLFRMSCHTVQGRLSLILIYYCDAPNSAQKTASSSSVKTILDKIFASSPVNACSVDPESVPKN